MYSRGAVCCVGSVWMPLLNISRKKSDVLMIRPSNLNSNSNSNLNSENLPKLMYMYCMCPFRRHLLSSSVHECPYIIKACLYAIQFLFIIEAVMPGTPIVSHPSWRSRSTFCLRMGLCALAIHGAHCQDEGEEAAASAGFAAA